MEMPNRQSGTWVCGSAERCAKFITAQVAVECVRVTEVTQRRHSKKTGRPTTDPWGTLTVGMWVKEWESQRQCTVRIHPNL